MWPCGSYTPWWKTRPFNANVPAKDFVTGMAKNAVADAFVDLLDALALKCDIKAKIVEADQLGWADKFSASLGALALSL
jgi:hypothetical protein